MHRLNNFFYTDFSNSIPATLAASGQSIACIYSRVDHHYTHATRRLLKGFKMLLEAFRRSSRSIFVVMMVLEDSDEIGIN